jgi:molybdate transport system permease protein
MFLHASDIDAIRLSLQVACAATLLATPAGIAAAYLLSRPHVPAKALLEAVVNLPLVLPPVVVGYVLLILLGRRGWIGAWLLRFDLHIIFTLAAAVVASMVVGFPLLVRAIRLGMEESEYALCHAVARTLGAGPWDSFFTITLPLAGRSILAGMTLMFARSLGEFGATIILAGNIPGVTQTIPLAIYEYINTPGGDRMALSLCLVSIALSLFVLLVTGMLGKILERK